MCKITVIRRAHSSPYSYLPPSTSCRFSDTMAVDVSTQVGGELAVHRFWWEAWGWIFTARLPWSQGAQCGSGRRLLWRWPTPAQTSRSATTHRRMLRMRPRPRSPRRAAGPSHCAPIRRGRSRWRRWSKPRSLTWGGWTCWLTAPRSGGARRGASLQRKHGINCSMLISGARSCAPGPPLRIWPRTVTVRSSISSICRPRCPSLITCRTQQRRQGCGT